MKITSAFILFILGCAIAPAGSAETESISGEVNRNCPYPEAKPSIPDGRNSTEEEMLTAQKAVKNFNAQGDAYIACLDKVEQGWGEEATPDQRSLLVILHNKMVDDMTGVADLFNSAIRAYKGKGKQ